MHHQSVINSLLIVRARRHSSSGNTQNVLGRGLGNGLRDDPRAPQVPIRYSQLAKPSLRAALRALSVRMDLGDMPNARGAFGYYPDYPWFVIFSPLLSSLFTPIRGAPQHRPAHAVYNVHAVVSPGPPCTRRSLWGVRVIPGRIPHAPYLFITCFISF